MPVTDAELVTIFSANTRPLDEGFDRAEQRVNQFPGVAQAASAKFDASFAQMAQSVSRTLSDIGMQMSMAFTAPAALAVGAVAKIGVSFDSLKQQALIAFETMLGSAEKAQSFLADLVDFARTTPFELRGLIPMAQQLLAVGFNAQEVIPMLMGIGDAMAALGRGADTMQRVILAITQMKSAGRVMGGEMRQLQEAGVPALEILAEHFGVTTAKMREMITKGAVPAQEAIGALVTGMEQKFGGLMEKQSHTLQGIISNIRDTADKLFGQILQPLVDRLTPALERVMNLMSAFGGAVQKLGLSGAISAMTGLSDTMVRFGAGLAAALAVAGPAALAIGKVVGIVAALADPAVAAVAAIVALAAAVGGVLAANVQGARDKLNALLGEIKALVERFRPQLEQIFNALAIAARGLIDVIGFLVGTIIDELRAVLMFLSGDWEGALAIWVNDQKAAFDFIANTLAPAFVAMLEAALSGIIGILREIFTLALTEAGGVLRAGMDTLASGFSAGMQRLPEIAGPAIAKLGEVIGAGIGFILKLVSAALDFAVQQIVEAFVKALENWPEIMVKVIAAVIKAGLAAQSAMDQLGLTLGKALIKGFVKAASGISIGGIFGGGESATADAAAKASLDDFIQKFLPSGADFSAKFQKFVDGIKAGFDGAAKSIKSSGAKSLKKATDEMLNEVNDYLSESGSKLKIDKDVWKNALTTPVKSALAEQAKAFRAATDENQRILAGMIAGHKQQVEVDAGLFDKWSRKAIDAVHKLGAEIQITFPAMDAAFAHLSDGIGSALAMGQGEYDNAIAAQKTFGDKFAAGFKAISDQAVKPFGEALKDELGNIRDVLRDDFSVQMASATNDVADDVNSLINKFTELANNMGLRGQEAVNFVLSHVQAAVSQIGAKWQGLTSKIITNWVDALNQLPGPLDEVVNKLLDSFGVLAAGARNKIKGAIGDIVGVIQTMPGSIGESLRRTMDQFQQWLAFLNNIFKLLHDTISDKFPKSVGDALDKVVGIFRDKGSEMADTVSQTAGQMVGSMASGMGSVTSTVTDASGQVVGVISDMGSQMAAAASQGMGGVVDATQAGMDEMDASVQEGSAKAIKAIAAMMAGIGMIISGHAQGGLSGAITGALGGFMTGMEIGSLIAPGIGTIIGGVVGAIGGFFAGIFGGGKSKDQKILQDEQAKQAQLQTQQMQQNLQKGAQEVIQAAMDTMQKAMETLSQLADFTKLPKGVIKAFFQNLNQVLNQFVDIVSKFSGSMLDQAKKFADSMGPVVDMIGNAVNALAALDGFTPIAQASIDAFMTALLAVLNAFDALTDQITFKAVKIAHKYANKIPEIISVIGSGVEAFTGLAQFQGVPDAAITAFMSALGTAINDMMELSKQVDNFFLKAAQRFSQKALDVINLIGNSVQAFVGLADFQAVAPASIDALGEGIKLAVEKMIALAGQLDAGMVKQASMLAGKLASIVAIIKDGADAFKALFEFQAVPAEVVEALFAGLEDATNRMIALAAKIDAGMLASAVKFAEKSTAIFDAIKSGVDAFKSLIDFQGIPADALKSFSDAMDAVIQLLSSLLSKATQAQTMANQFARTMQGVAKALASGMAAVGQGVGASIKSATAGALAVGAAAAPALAGGGAVVDQRTIISGPVSVTIDPDKVRSFQELADWIGGMSDSMSALPQATRKR